MKGVLSKLRPLHISLLLGVLTASVSYLAYERSDAFRSTLLHAFELKVLDANFRLRGRQDVDPTVVIAAGDAKTIEQFGLWGQWDRGDIAAVVDNLVAAEADVIAFDMIFADRVGIGAEFAEKMSALIEDQSLSGPLEAAEGRCDEVQLGALATQARELEELIRQSRSGTSRLGEVFDEHSSRITQGFIVHPSRVSGLKKEASIADLFEQIEPFTFDAVGYELLQRKMENAGEGVEETVIQLKTEENLAVKDLTYVEEIIGGFDLPLPEYLEAAEYIGYFSVDPDPDGVVRAIPLVYRYGNRLIPSMTLMAASQHFGASPLFIADPAVGKGLLQIVFPAEEGQTISIPVDHRGRLLINYLGESKAYDEGDAFEKRGVFHRVSLADIRNGDKDALEAVKGKVVIVAVTAIGTFDQRVTPFTPIAPGVEVHAAALQSMISGNSLTRNQDTVFIEMLLSILLALILGLALKRLPIYASSIFSIVVSVAWALAVHQLFKQSMWFHTGPLQAQIWLSWAGITVYGYLTEGREKALLKREFSTVLAPTVVDQLLQNPDLAGLGGAERNLTVMFSDIRGFTSMSEKMSPEGLTQFLNEYLTPMTDILIERQGTLDKYMGDAIMAFWGAPIAQPDHAARACLAALDMLEKLDELHKRWHEEGKPEIDIGIGLNTGLMRVGFMGSERMRNYTLLGDNVNLGSRLEGINKTYKTNIIISEWTYNEAKAAVFARVIDAVRVKGKREPVTIMELRGRGTPTGDEKVFLDDFAKALSMYRGQRFAEAKVMFEALAAAGDGTSQVYVDRCDLFLADPPGPDWDGVFEMKTK